MMKSKHISTQSAQGQLKAPQHNLSKTVSMAAQRPKQSLGLRQDKKTMVDTIYYTLFIESRSVLSFFFFSLSTLYRPLPKVSRN